MKEVLGIMAILMMVATSISIVMGNIDNATLFLCFSILFRTHLIEHNLNEKK